MLSKFALFAILASVSSSPVKENGIAENLVGAVSECLDVDTSLCLKEKAFKFTERLAISKDLDIFEGMSLVNTGSARSARSYEPLLAEPKARELQLDERIADNVGDFLDNHVLQLRLTEPDNESRGLDEEGRGKKKKKLKQLLPILLLLKLKLAALIPIFLGIIAIVAVKAVFLGKIAFAMNAFNLIRKLIASKGGSSSPSTSYGAPVHHEEHPGYSYEPAQSAGWGRQGSDAQSLAYAGHLSN
ncbi:Osiris 9C [Operophtera brumata]|uniref:Osiris 9C n=1 Tax=Operophtera brumata TaxID=104452 RepID=A0A0L7L0U4_OPEBR|nr:Osiris 9C [Operophtera brumata]